MTGLELRTLLVATGCSSSMSLGDFDCLLRIGLFSSFAPAVTAAAVDVELLLVLVVVAVTLLATAPLLTVIGACPASSSEVFSLSSRLF